MSQTNLNISREDELYNDLQKIKACLQNGIPWPIQKFNFIERICNLHVPYHENHVRAVLFSECIKILDLQEKCDAPLRDRQAIISVASTCIHNRFNPNERTKLAIVSFDLHAENSDELALDHSVIETLKNDSSGTFLDIDQCLVQLLKIYNIAQAKSFSLDSKVTRTQKLEWFNYGQVAFALSEKIMNELRLISRNTDFDDKELDTAIVSS